MVTINKIAKFLTGSSKIPATGLNKNVTVKFKHDCFPSKSGNICKCLPTTVFPVKAATFASVYQQ